MNTIEALAAELGFEDVEALIEVVAEALWHSDESGPWVVGSGGSVVDGYRGRARYVLTALAKRSIV